MIVARSRRFFFLPRSEMIQTTVMPHIGRGLHRFILHLSSRYQLSKVLQTLSTSTRLLFKLITSYTHMGNAETSTARQSSMAWLKQYEVVEENLRDNIMLIQSIKTGEEYYGKTLICRNKEEVEKVERLMQLKSSSDNKYVSKVLYFGKKDSQSFCSTTKEYSLVFQKGDFSLKDEIYNRKFRFQQFHQAEIMLVLQSVMKGLLFLKQIKEVHRRIGTENIFIRKDRSVFISDPWLYPGKETSIFKMNETGYNYPSPQKILFQSDLIDSYDEHLSDYYSLGIALLELVNMEPMDHIYEKGFRRILDKVIVSQIGKVKREDLRERIQILVSHHPQKRAEIERTYQKPTNSEEFIKNQINQFKEKIKGSHKIALLNGKNQVNKGIQNDPRLINVEFQPHVRTESRLTVSNHFNEKTYPNSNATMLRPKIVFTHNPNPQHSIKLHQIIMTNQINNNGQIKTKEKIEEKSKNNIPQQTNQPKDSYYLSSKPDVIKQLSIEEDSNHSNTLNLPNPSFSLDEHMSNNVLKEISYKKLNEFQNMIKQAQSINASMDQKSEIASEVIGHGFSAKNSISIGINSRRQSIDDVRRSLPEPSYEELPKPQSNVTYKINAPPQNYMPYQPIIQQKASQVQQNTLTPDRKPLKKRNHSTIKEVSQESPSIQSHSFQYQQRTIQYDVGTKYIGQLKNGKRNGQGIFYFQDGSYYEGSWKDNKMHGKGSLYYANGQLAYEGGWYMDSFHGRGKIYNDTPQQLQLEFNYNNMNFVDNHWEVYEGDFFNEKRNGNGKLKLSNGEVFVGEFMDDKVNGQGRFYQLSGRVVHGKWVQGILVKEYS